MELDLVRGHEPATYNLPIELVENVQKWLELRGVEPTEEAQSLLVEVVLLQLSNGSIAEATEFHFKEFAKYSTGIEVPKDFGIA